MQETTTENPAQQKPESSMPTSFLVVQLVYVAALLSASFYVGHGLRLSLILIAAALVLLGRLTIRVSSFLRMAFDFVPFILLLISYEALRGVAYDYSESRVHFQSLITAEAFLFGRKIPTQVLQELCLGSKLGNALIETSKAVYTTHFVAPLVLAAFLWVRRKAYFKPYVVGLISMSYTGFLSYLLYPAAPPWLASQNGYLSLPLQFVTFTDQSWFSKLLHISPNPVAAMPSLHAGYSLYIAMFAVYVFRARAIWVCVFPIAMCFATVLLAQHYVVDLLAGGSYAVVFFLLTSLLMRSKRFRTVGSQKN
jgi:membrane-associated phospholipid phosphatase